MQSDSLVGLEGSFTVAAVIDVLRGDVKLVVDVEVSWNLRVHRPLREVHAFDVVLGFAILHFHQVVGDLQCWWS